MVPKRVDINKVPRSHEPNDLWLHTVCTYSGWWFGTYIGNNHPNSLIFFKGVETTNQYCMCHGQARIYFPITGDTHPSPFGSIMAQYIRDDGAPHLHVAPLNIKRRLGLEMFPTKWSCIKVFPDMNGD